MFLILTGDARNADLAGWCRGRSVLLGVDKKLANTRAACRVRAMPGGDEPRKNHLRPAGRLSRRDLKRPARAPDFARALGAIRTTMTRDLAALERSGLRAARPTAVFYAVEPPLADAITAEEYEKLARQASILWIVPEASAALMSPRFAGEDARILTDHCAVTDEVFHLLLFRDREDVAAPGLSGEVGGLVSRVSFRGFRIRKTRVTRPSSTTRLTAAGSPATSIRPARVIIPTWLASSPAKPLGAWR